MGLLTRLHHGDCTDGAFDQFRARARLGLLVPHAAIGSESELAAMVPEGVSVHAARVPLGVMRPGGVMDPTIALAPVRAFADPPLVDDAAELLAAAPLHAIGFAFTASSYVRGPADDEALRRRLEARTRGIPVASTAASAVLALRALGAARLALIEPPWFSPELSALGAAYFANQGVEVVRHGAAGLPSEQRAIHPGLLYEWARTHVPAAAEAVFIGGNGLRAVGVIQALEEDLGVPVLTANQVLCWHLLRLAGTRAAVSGYGCLFDQSLPSDQRAGLALDRGHDDAGLSDAPRDLGAEARVIGWQSVGGIRIVSLLGGRKLRILGTPRSASSSEAESRLRPPLGNSGQVAKPDRIERLKLFQSGPFVGQAARGPRAAGMSAAATATVLVRSQASVTRGNSACPLPAK